MEKSPDAFRTISEVADALETPPHVLRFWESRFTQIKPVKRAGGRRYYRPSDVALLSGIKMLLHEEGMTIRGVQKMLREHGIRHVQALADGGAPAAGVTPKPVVEAKAAPQNVVPLSAAKPAEPAPEPAAVSEHEDLPEAGTGTAAKAPELPADTAPEPEPQATQAEQPMPAPTTQGEFFFDDTHPAPAPESPPAEPPASEASPASATETGPTDSPLAARGPDEFDWADEASPAAEAPSGEAHDEPVNEVAAEPIPETASLADSVAEADPEEDQGPTLAARLRTLSPAQAAPDVEALATLSDRLKALRHKMAGHARRGPR